MRLPVPKAAGLCAATLLMAWPGMAAAQVPPTQRAWLVQLYEQTNGPDWSLEVDGGSTVNSRANWLQGDPCRSQWWGVSCNPAGTSVTQLNLGNNKLEGQLPAGLAQALPDLERIFLSQNALTGTFPPLDGLRQLTEVSLTDLNLPGRLPDWRQLPNLRTWSSGGNRLEGPIGALPVDIEDFSVSNNLLSGSLPDLTPLHQLRMFMVSDNRLSGELPGTLEHLDHLGMLHLHHNQLSGTLPMPPRNLWGSYSTIVCSGYESNIDTNRFIASPHAAVNAAWNHATRRKDWTARCQPPANTSAAPPAPAPIATPAAPPAATPIATRAQAPGTWHSQYTPLELSQCQTAPALPDWQDMSVLACPGLKGHVVRVAEGDSRFFISYGPSAAQAAQEPATLQTLMPFNQPGKTVEWLLAPAPSASGAGAAAPLVPVATILRWHLDTAEATGEKQDGQVLVVTRIAPGQTCQVAHIDARANPDANTLAREAAQRLVPDFDCDESPLRYGTWRAF